MEATRPAPLAKPAPAVEARTALLAKAAFRRLALSRLEPTPENYERAYRYEAGEPEPSGEALASLIDRLVRGMERGGQNWTVARRRDGLQRVLSNGRADASRLQHRLTQLVGSWESDAPSVRAVEDARPDSMPAPFAVTMEPGALQQLVGSLDGIVLSAPPGPAAAALSAPHPWELVARLLGGALQQALPRNDAANAALADELVQLLQQIERADPDAGIVAETTAIVQRAERVLQHRQHLFDQLGKLCGELTGSLADLAEDGSWVQGQCAAMRAKIDEGLTARGVRSVSDMLHHARTQHATVRGEREKARDALKTVISQMLGELGDLGSTTDHFSESVGRYAAVIEESDSLESLTGVVQKMVTESRSVQTLVRQTQQRLHEEHSKATGLTERVNQLEDEMKRLSDEVSTDQLTQVANRRGLMQMFETERAKLERNGGALSIGLLDIDNFKRLNDELGHSAGDEALKALAGTVSKTLRPGDHVARYGGEEFVVLLPETAVGEGEQVLTRLQRSLTNGLFMHKQKQVFVTFSAGVTAYRGSERIEEALERADQALYEAKRTGKNRTCIG